MVPSSDTQGEGKSAKSDCPANGVKIVAAKATADARQIRI
jgi:hypothetical protein